VPKLRVHNFAISLDGYGAGPDQSIDDPLGLGGRQLHQWAFATATFHGTEGGGTGVDDDFVKLGEENIGATVMGRNMFGPVRGAWNGSDWTGWWGDEPPYHHPVFVLTHYAHEPIVMQGGTTFHFVTEGPEAALERAFDAADGADVRLGGGVGTVREYLRLGLVDEMHLAIAPVLLRSGEHLLGNLDQEVLGRYECVEYVGSPAVAHMQVARV
jgi:dihydrofolate reductase